MANAPDPRAGVADAQAQDLLGGGGVVDKLLQRLADVDTRTQLDAAAVRALYEGDAQ